MNYMATFHSFPQIMDALHIEEDCRVYWEYALEWKTNLSALRLYLRALLQNILRMGAKGCTSSRTVVVGV